MLFHTYQYKAITDTNSEKQTKVVFRDAFLNFTAEDISLYAILNVV